MADDIKVKKREPGFFIIDNEIIDVFGLNPYEITYYNFLCRYSNQDQAFLSKSKLAKQYKTSRNRWISAEKKLIDLNLISKMAFTDSGVPIYQINNAKEVAKVFLSRAGVPVENRGCSHTEQGGVPTQNINKTIYNKTNKQDIAESKDSPVEHSNIKNNHKQVTEVIYNIMTIYNNGSKPIWHGAKYGQAIKKMLKDSTPDEIKRKAVSFIVAIKRGDDFLKKIGLTPSTLMSRWHTIDMIDDLDYKHYSEKLGVV